MFWDVDCWFAGGWEAKSANGSALSDCEDSEAGSAWNGFCAPPGDMLAFSPTGWTAPFDSTKQGIERIVLLTICHMFDEPAHEMSLLLFKLMNGNASLHPIGRQLFRSHGTGK